jgi:hypothetical protein
MLKVLICLFSAAALAASILQLRQQRLELDYQNAELHEQIRSHQARLWDQQLQIAAFTAPNAIANTVNAQNLKLVPRQQPLGTPTKNSAEPQQTGPSSTNSSKKPSHLSNSRSVARN